MNDIYNGPSGYNPELGQLTDGQEIKVPDGLRERFKKFLTKSKKKKDNKKQEEVQWPDMG